MYMSRAKSPKPTVSKSDFVRSQPSTLSAAEVLAKAKEAGIKLTPQLVYKVRSDAKPKSKAAFVRGLPVSTPAKDVVKQAKALGLTLSINYVYNIRGAAKTAAKKKRAAAKSPAVNAVMNGAGSRVSASAESLLKAVAAEIGLGPAIEILQGERARVHVVLRG
jgi:hypothetical protein